MLPYVISQDIVRFLHEVKGFSLEEIASVASLSSIDDIDLILKSKKTFQIENIQSIINNQNITIISLLADACPENHLPEKLRRNVSCYKQIKENIRRKRKK